MTPATTGIVAASVWQALRVTGPAADRFLQRMLSNALPPPAAAHARGAFLLQPTGRLVSGGIWFRHGDGWVALSPDGWRQSLRAGLEKYRVADPVEFADDPTPATLWLNPPDTILPPRPWDVVATASGAYVRWDGGGAPTLAGTDAERLRVEAGAPAFGRELTDETIPLEAGCYDWLSHAKGCYVGQEVIERMWSRERMARRLVWFRGDAGDPPEPPVDLSGDEGRGRMTSVARAADGTVLGLGYYPAASGDATARTPDGRRWRIEPVPPQRSDETS